jgi:primosomal replication protein N
MAIINKSTQPQPSVLGVTVFYAEDNAETSNNSATVYNTKVTLTTPATLPLGNYILQYQFIWRAANADREADFQIRLNGTEITQWNPTTSRTQDRQLLSGFDFIESISGTNTIDFRFKRINSATTIFVRNARLFLTRVL